MPTYSIEARAFRVALAWSHCFWVLRHADLGTIAELHGLAFDRITRTILPIGTTRDHSLRVFVFAHEAAYAARLGIAVSSTRMYARSRARLVHEGEDALARWDAAVAAMPLLDRLDLTYPPFGFNVLTPTVNSNSAYRTFGEIMDVPVPDFRGAFRPGAACRMCTAEEIERVRFRNGNAMDPRDVAAQRASSSSQPCTASPTSSSTSASLRPDDLST